MCRLVGWVSEQPTTIAEVLGEAGLADLTALSHLHEDGWGLAWWAGDRLQTQTSHRSAHLSPEYEAATREVRTDAGLLHLRWATPGLAVAPHNSHPFLAGDRAFGHNGAVRPADGLLDLLSAEQVAGLRGDTDSERLMHVLLDRVDAHGLDEGLRETVRDVCRQLTPSSLNALLLDRPGLTAVCCHGLPQEGEAPVSGGPPEDQPGYFDLRWLRTDGAVVIASEPLGPLPWQRLANGTALAVRRGSLEVRTVPVGTLAPAALQREQARRLAALGAP